jgi:RNA polymerase sigma-70 factor (ECF subfamily)
MRTGFDDLYEDHVSDVYGFFAYRLGSRQFAEDLTQVTFLKAMRAWDRYDPVRAAPLTWLLAIARNVLVDHYRADHAGRHEAELDDRTLDATLGHAPGPEASVGLDPQIERALTVLSDRDREVLALRYGADLTGPEIAELLGLSLANVQQIVSRSLRKLRAELGGG